MWLRWVLERVGGAPALIVLLLGLLLLAVAIVVLALLLVLRRGSGLTLLLPPLLLGAVSRVFDGRGHVPHPVWFVGRLGRRGGPMLGWCRFCTSGIRSLSALFLLSHVPLPLLSYSPSSIRGLALTAAVSDLLAKEAIKLAPPSPGFYSRPFVTPKVTGGWRPVIDLSHLNGFVDVSHFHMETTQTVLQSLREGDWLVSLHLQDAYLQVLVHPSSRRYLRFCVGESVYQFRALYFGLSTAPQVFTRVMAPVSVIMHRHGFRILRYLDDWLVLASTFQESVQARNFLLWLCQNLGIHVNLPKSSLTPMQTQDYLGIRFRLFL